MAQHLARPAIDEMQPRAGRTVHAIVLAFWRVIAVFQPVLDPEISCRAGENDRTAHRATIVASGIGEIALSQLSNAAVAHLSKGDPLRAVGHAPLIPPTGAGVKPLGNRPPLER